MDMQKGRPLSGAGRYSPEKRRAGPMPRMMALTERRHLRIGGFTVK